MTRIFCILLALALTTGSLWADEGIRQIQEQLRKRSLYFGDINGRPSEEFVDALKKYQERKGFPPTGRVDDVTATSLNVRLAAAASVKDEWPQEPILRSDNALELTEAQREILEASASADLSAATPPPPAESPAPSQNIPRERLQAMVEESLRDAEKDNVEAQVRYFAFPVDYFDHGPVDAAFVRRGTARYVKRWPQREYRLTDSVRFIAAANDTDTLVQFPIEFNLSSPARKATARGRTMNFWTIRPEGDELKIVSIREERLRE
ncbi:hypothetical protein BH20VER2_BH20VER2_04700 [soil metagenome]